jgi:glycosyltransferase involved in cell wall biosynthesis
MGYNSSKMVVIPNGYDTTLLIPDKAKRKKFRNELGVFTDIPVLGMVARYHPQKGHSYLLNALGILRDRGGRFKCVLVGPGMNSDNKELCTIIDDLKLFDFLSLMDERADVSTVMNGLDLHVLSSLCEAFPNVVAEAMACGTPCVVTDVGDAAFIVGPSGWVVPASDSQSLANAIELALDEMREQPERWKQRQSAASTRILENYSLESMIAKFHDVWEKSVRR